MSFQFQPLAIPEVILIKPDVFGDDRGFFMESFKSSVFEANGIPDAFVQDNHSCSQKGVLRGLHYQLPPKAQGKLVRVARGAIFDVAVDVRRSSPTFGQWVSAELTDDNHHMLWVPCGFAHGFLTLQDNTHVLYKTTDEYSPEHERSIRWNDSDIDITWPFDDVVLSGKDEQAALLKDATDLFD